MPAGGRVVERDAPISWSPVTPDEALTSSSIAFAKYDGIGTLAVHGGGVTAPPLKSFKHMMFPNATVLSAIVTSRSCACCPSKSWWPSVAGPTDPKRDIIADGTLRGGGSGGPLVYPVLGECKKPTTVDHEPNTLSASFCNLAGSSWGGVTSRGTLHLSRASVSV